MTIRVFYILGREIGSILGGEAFEEGFQSVEFVADGLATGVYFYRIEAQGLEDGTLRTVETKKMLLLR